jgi:thiamine-monophosphate kinase
VQAQELALHGGGDYELIFTCSRDRHPIAGVQYTVIGEVIADRRVLVDGNLLEKRGYQHTWV